VKIIWNGKRNGKKLLEFADYLINSKKDKEKVLSDKT
tara:strand:+ start:911 stop:1021 length:111 start_codon:yes stop_codon:yes gene_type:complete